MPFPLHPQPSGTPQCWPGSCTQPWIIKNPNENEKSGAFSPGKPLATGYCCCCEAATSDMSSALPVSAPAADVPRGNRRQNLLFSLKKAPTSSRHALRVISCTKKSLISTVQKSFPATHSTVPQGTGCSKPLFPPQGTRASPVPRSNPPAAFCKRFPVRDEGQENTSHLFPPEWAPWDCGAAVWVPPAVQH